MAEEEQPHRRKYVRMVLTEAVIAEFRILGLGNREVEASPHNVVLIDLSPGGVRFKTMLHLKPEASWRVALRFEMEGYRLEMRGLIRWATKEDNWWQYGVEMESNPMMRMLITRALNMKLVRLSPAIRLIHERYGRSSYVTGKRK